MGLLDRLWRRNLTPLDPSFGALIGDLAAVSYTHLRAHET